MISERELASGLGTHGVVLADGVGPLQAQTVNFEKK